MHCESSSIGCAMKRANLDKTVSSRMMFVIENLAMFRKYHWRITNMDGALQFKYLPMSFTSAGESIDVDKDIF
jgi:hypothetical protein